MVERMVVGFLLFVFLLKIGNPAIVQLMVRLENLLALNGSKHGRCSITLDYHQFFGEFMSSTLSQKDLLRRGLATDFIVLNGKHD